MTTSRRLSPCGLTLAAASALLLAISGIEAAEPKRGGSLSISIESDLPTLDPIGFASFNDRQAGITLYDTLLDIDSKGKLVPNLAEKMEPAEDATSFRITLRSGVKFHDGIALDADAVVAHFRRMMDPKLRCRCLSDLSAIDAIEATGPLQVTFKMKAPSAHFPAVLADVSGMIVSPAAVAKFGSDLATNPVGSPTSMWLSRPPDGAFG